jgi:hypothetical protein
LFLVAAAVVQALLGDGAYAVKLSADQKKVATA